jgi:hypothetical protein
MLLLDDEEGVDKLMEMSRTSDEYGHLPTCKSKFGNTIDDRVNYVLKNREYELQHDSYREEFDARDFSPEEIRQFVPSLAENLVDIQDRVDEYPSLGTRLEEFRDALWDIEAVYVGSVIGGYRQ